jgi:hypothetical protein
MLSLHSGKNKTGWQHKKTSSRVSFLRTLKFVTVVVSKQKLLPGYKHSNTSKFRGKIHDQPEPRINFTSDI